MPIFEIICTRCDFAGELIVMSQGDPMRCPECGSGDVRKLISATSSLTGKNAQTFPGPGDTACCGQSPGHASCAGPGSCCGKTF